MAGEEHYRDGRRRHLAALPGGQLQRQRGKRFKSCTQNSEYAHLDDYFHLNRLFCSKRKDNQSGWRRKG